jgi:hypothetical protein
MATHYMGRELLALGHVVKQVPPAFAKAFRRGHKNDFRDAHAVAEAVQRPSTRCALHPRRPCHSASSSELAKHSFGPWLTAAARRLHCNVLTVALANKLAAAVLRQR